MKGVFRPGTGRRCLLALLFAPVFITAPAALADAGQANPRITPPPRPSVETQVEPGEPRVEMMKNRHHTGMTKNKAKAKARAKSQGH